MREHARKLTAEEIVAELGALIGLDTERGGPEGRGMWVTLSGGNPALMRFTHGVHLMQRLGMLVAVETQGSVWRAWLSDVDHLTVSPKPPSSGMATLLHMVQTTRFLSLARDMPYDRRSLKVVVFDDVDYAFAGGLFQTYPDWQHFLSVGTDQDYLQDEYRVHNGIAERYGWLCEKVAADPMMRNVKVLPQLHVIAFGTGRGV